MRARTNRLAGLAAAAFAVAFGANVAAAGDAPDALLTTPVTAHQGEDANPVLALQKAVSPCDQGVC